MWLRTFVLLGLAATAAAAQAPARIRGPVELRQTVRLQGNTVWRARHALDQGPAPADLPMRHMLLLLKPSPAQKMALEDLLSAQREQDSPQYHHWLTPQEFGQHFGPAPSDIATVEHWLQGQGFQVEQVSSGGLVIEFSGTAATVQRALHTSIHRYQVQRPGQASALHWANAADPAIPAALAPVVAGVVSLGNFFKTPMVHLLGKGTAPHRQVGGAAPELNYTGSNGITDRALVPGDFQTIYNVPPSPDGTGETIAVVARSEVEGEDFTQWRALFLPSASGTLNTIIATPTSPGATGDEDQQEATLDAEWAGAAAPDATIDLVVAASSDTTDGVDLSALYIVNHDLAPIMSTSFGECEAQMGATENQFWNNLWEQAAAEGISVFVSAGDNGPAACDAASATTAENGLAVSGLASTPYDTAVGGTEFDESLDNGNDSTYWSQESQDNYSSALGHIPEVPWNEHGEATDGGGLWSGSGGTSDVYGRPVWQSPSVPGMSAKPGQSRLLPDMALAAAGHDGYVVCEGGSCTETPEGFEFYVFSGTSASSPAMAGVMALVDQHLGGRQGMADPVLYRLASSPSEYAAVFHDVTQGNTDIPCAAGSPDCPSSGTFGYSATTGYDLATGLGSLDVTSLVDDWSNVGLTSSQTSLTLSLPASPVYGQSVPLTVAVTNSGESGPVPTGAIELLQQASDGTQTPLQTFTLDASGQVTASTALLPAGTYAVVARYGGDGTYGASTSPPISVTIAKQTVTVTLTISLPGSPLPVSSAIYGDVLQETAALVDAAGRPIAGAAVTFAYTLPGQAALPMGSAVTGELGTATLTAAYSGPLGASTITAQFAGNGDYNPASSTPSALQIQPSPTTIALADQNDTLQIVIHGQSTGAAPSGYLEISTSSSATPMEVPVQASSGSRDPSTGFIDAQATFALFLFSFPGPTASISVHFDGLPSAQPEFLDSDASLTITTPANLVYTPPKLTFGPIDVGTTSSTQSVMVKNAGGEAGSASFSSTDPNFPFTTDCPLTLSSGESCSVSVAFQAAATLTGADTGTWIIAGQGPSGFVVTGNFRTFAPEPPGTILTLQSGGSATASVQVVPYNGYTGSVSLSCAQLPLLASCSFDPPTVQLDGTHPAQTTLTIATAQPVSSASDRFGGLGPVGMGGMALALLLGAWLYAGVDHRRLRPASLVTIGITALLLVAIACGGGGSKDNPPPVAPPPAPPTSPTLPSASPAAAQVLPSQLSFGLLTVGATSTAQSVTLSSTGGQALNISAAAITGPQAADFHVTANSCPASLAPGSQCTLSVVFQPSLNDRESASLEFTDSDPASQKIALQGTGASSTPAGTYSVQIIAADAVHAASSYMVVQVN